MDNTPKYNLHLTDNVAKSFCIELWFELKLDIKQILLNLKEKN